MLMRRKLKRARRGATLSGRPRDERVHSVYTDITIQFDDHEQYPLLFPAMMHFRPREDVPTRVFRVTPYRKRMPTADYFIVGQRRACLVERKASVQELQANLFGDARKRANFLHSLDRMVGESDNPYLFLDMRWSDLWRSTDDRGKPCYREPFMLLDHLLAELKIRNIQLIGPQAARTVGTRRIAGSLLLRVMLSHIYPSRAARPAEPLLTPEVTRIVADGEPFPSLRIPPRSNSARRNPRKSGKGSRAGRAGRAKGTSAEGGAGNAVCGGISRLAMRPVQKIVQKSVAQAGTDLL